MPWWEKILYIDEQRQVSRVGLCTSDHSLVSMFDHHDVLILFDLFMHMLNKISCSSWWHFQKVDLLMWTLLLLSASEACHFCSICHSFCNLLTWGEGLGCFTVAQLVLQLWSQFCEVGSPKVGLFPQVGTQIDVITMAWTPLCVPTLLSNLPANFSQ